MPNSPRTFLEWCLGAVIVVAATVGADLGIDYIVRHTVGW